MASSSLPSPADPVFDGVFGPYTITDQDRREVLGYRLALTAVALGQLGLLLTWRQGSWGCCSPGARGVRRCSGPGCC